MDRGEVCSRFLEQVSYALYPFQEEALLAWFEAEGGLLVTAPTGMGKTLIAEAAIFEALATRQRMYYTTPLIALTDQKFREFQDKAESWGFSREDVGLVTGNRRENPNALVRVVVAEILLNHLLASPPPLARGDEATTPNPLLGKEGGPSEREQTGATAEVTTTPRAEARGSLASLADVASVVMDEFHYFNDLERGIVWELSVVLLPAHVRLMLLSATIGNGVDLLRWVSEQHGRQLRLVQSDQRRVPLEFNWVGDKLLTEHLPEMVSKDDAANRTPALVFCFNRDECWEVAERLKGVSLIDPAMRAQIEERFVDYDLSQGAGPKLKQMLIRGVGVHHAGILPKYKELVEAVFNAKLVPFVICTETLAAGINLPARSVVLSTLLHGKPGERKLVHPAAAHQMFGRAGRPQFDSFGYVYAMTHEDDAKIAKWRKKYDQIDPKSKDPGVMRVRKDLERKKPSRRSTEEYWTEGQFRTLVKAGPGKLYSRSMIPYSILIYLLDKTGTLHDVRAFLSKRFTTYEHIGKFQKQLDAMIDNLAKFGYLTRAADSEHVTVNPAIRDLLLYRGVDPLYGEFLKDQLTRADFQEKVQALESVLPVPPAMEKQVRLPESLTPGPLHTHVLVPLLVQMGIALTHPEGGVMAAPDADEGADYMADDRPPRAMTLPEMLKALFDAKLASPEDVWMQPKWVAGGVFEMDCDFYKFIRARDLAKNEGLVLRHLLRLVILAGEFLNRSGGDPDYERIGELATRACKQVDPRYTDRFLAAEAEAQSLSPVN
jgi:superfamily II DNA/RNA helicase